MGSGYALIMPPDLDCIRLLDTVLVPDPHCLCSTRDSLGFHAVIQIIFEIVQLDETYRLEPFPYATPRYLPAVGTLRTE